jgi:predicted ester cyclase
MLYGCSTCNKSKKKPNVNNINVQLEVRRFEQDFFTIPVENPSEALKQLKKKYPDFAPFYFSEIMGFGNLDKDEAATAINFSVYRNDQYVKQVADTCLRVFKDFSAYEKELTQAFRYFKYYFPNYSVPQIITFTGNFGWSAVSYDTSILGIGVDMYLGEDYKFYPSVYPKYLYEKFKPEYMVANAMNVAAGIYFNFEPTDNTILAHCVAAGKKLYFLDLVLPDVKDYLKIGYNSKDIEWCMSNEAQIWGFFIKHDVLYKTENKELKKYIGAAPNTAGMPVESPGNIGAWVGWQIVRKYMEKHPEVTFEQLLVKDPQEILNASKYKPK